MEYIVSYITYMHGSLSSSWDAKLARNLGNMGSDRQGRNVGLVAEPITLGPTTSALMVLAVHETWC